MRNLSNKWNYYTKDPIQLQSMLFIGRGTEPHENIR